MIGTRRVTSARVHVRRPSNPAEPALTDVAAPSTARHTPAAAAAASDASRAPSRRLPFIDALRGIAALWVLIFHIAEGGQIAALQAVLPSWVNLTVFKFGHFGVPIFFVLSGFVIALSINDDRVTLRYIGRFALRRAIRLDLPYWASIAITLAFVAIKARMLPQENVPIATVPQVLAHLFYLQEFLGYREINAVFWTLCYEVQFYLMFCALIGLAQAFRRTEADQWPLAIVFALTAVVSIIWPLTPSLDVRGLALPNWHGFLLGAFVYWTLKGRMSTGGVALYSTALLGMFAVTRDSFTLVCLATATLILLVGRADRLRMWLSGSTLQFLGRISYSIYLLHLPVVGAAFFVLNKLLPRTPAMDLLAGLIVIAVTCGAAQLFWWVVERPSTALARRLRKRD